MKTYIGVDNGVTGSLAVIDNAGFVECIPTPVISQQDYTKTKKNITRINVRILREWLSNAELGQNLVIIERPMVNPRRFHSTISAVRSLEATLTVIESLNLPYTFIDSKEWQKEMLPSGIKGSPELKKASLDRGLQLFPSQTDIIKKQGDADSLLIAEYARRKQL